MAQNTLAYLGPEGTYSHEAANAFKAKLEAAGVPDCELVPCVSFTEVFDAVERGRVTYGVVATENSLEGPVTATLDNFASSSGAVILGMHVIDIDHCLIKNPTASLVDIDTIASHAQGIGQCRRFIASRFLNVKTVTTSSTAESVRLCMERPNVAAIANEYAANLYGAEVCDRQIADRFGNQTSFALIGRPGQPQVFKSESGKMRTSVALFLQADRAGALQMILSEFAYADVNITMIQSRPTKQALGDYMFFLDLEGSVEQPSLQTALNCLRLKLREVKVLGSYPVD